MRKQKVLRPETKYQLGLVNVRDSSKRCWYLVISRAFSFWWWGVIIGALSCWGSVDWSEWFGSAHYLFRLICRCEGPSGLVSWKLKCGRRAVEKCRVEDEAYGATKEMSSSRRFCYLVYGRRSSFRPWACESSGFRGSSASNLLPRSVILAKFYMFYDRLWVKLKSVTPKYDTWRSLPQEHLTTIYWSLRFARCMQRRVQALKTTEGALSERKASSFFRAIRM